MHKYTCIYTLTHAHKHSRKQIYYMNIDIALDLLTHTLR